MTNLIFNNNYPNVIVFTHNDMDGIFSAMIIKMKYDNNLLNSDWEKNVTCHVCSYGEKYRNLDWFKDKVNESYIKGARNIVYMTDYAIQPNNLMVNFWNWLSDKGCEFYWIDHHITSIENLNHYNIPGYQRSCNSGCMNTWYTVMKVDDTIPTAPLCLKYANDFDIWNKESEYSWDKQLYPLCYFIESLGIELNDNTRRISANML